MTEQAIEAEAARAATHAGAVTFQITNGRTLYLIVSSSSGDNWVLPKGHIAPGESSADAALRELREEAGVIGQILDSLSIQQFKKVDEEVVVQYFLVRAMSFVE